MSPLLLETSEYLLESLAFCNHRTIAQKGALEVMWRWVAFVRKSLVPAARPRGFESLLCRLPAQWTWRGTFLLSASVSWREQE